MNRLLLCALALLPFACSTPDTIQPTPEPASPAGGGGAASSPSAQTAGTSGLAGAGGKEASAGAEQAGGAGSPSACPSTKGPAMVRVSGPTSSFCIDTTEVTQAHYVAFLDEQSKSPPAQVHEACAFNTVYTPVMPDPSGMEYGGCTPFGWTMAPPPDNAPGLRWVPGAETATQPMTCVDWCDAKAYCAWAGKRLCGQVGGGEYTQAAQEAGKGELAYACSQGGKTKLPYGDSYQEGSCAKKAGEGKAKESVGTTACHGTETPYREVYDLVGNVDEWEDGAIYIADEEGATMKKWFAPTTVSEASTFVKDPTTVSCQSRGITVPNSQSPNVGFRCCAD